VNRRQIIEREANGQRLAGFMAIAALPAFIAAQAIRNGGGIAVSGVATEQVSSFHAHSGTVIISGLITALQFGLLVYPLYYLFRAAQARSERVNPAMLGFIFIGPLLFAVQSVVFAIANVNLASDFVAQASAGGDIYNLLEDLSDDSTISQVGQYLVLPAILGLVVAMVYVPLNAFRVGLLTRFFGTLGMALGVSQILIAPQLSQTALMAWFAWLGFLILDRIPRGRPPAWDAGEAIPWPRPGEDAATATPVPDSVVEGDASEAFESGSADHSARRDRAKKKKRKRRG
jgi:hypothetical protein